MQLKPPVHRLFWLACAAGGTCALLRCDHRAASEPEDAGAGVPVRARSDGGAWRGRQRRRTLLNAATDAICLNSCMVQSFDMLSPSFVMVASAARCAALQAAAFLCHQAGAIPSRGPHRGEQGQGLREPGAAVLGHAASALPVPLLCAALACFIWSCWAAATAAVSVKPGGLSALPAQEHPAPSRQP